MDSKTLANFVMCSKSICDESVLKICEKNEMLKKNEKLRHGYFYIIYYCHRRGNSEIIAIVDSKEKADTIRVNTKNYELNMGWDTIPTRIKKIQKNVNLLIDGIKGPEILD